MNKSLNKILEHVKTGINRDSLILEYNNCTTGEETNKLIEKVVDFNKVFIYSESACSGIIMKSNVNGASRIGKECGRVQSYGKIGRKRFVIGVFGATLKVHRIIYLMFNDIIPPDFVIDHIDGNPLNNKIENLRAITKKHNNRSVALRQSNILGKIGVGKYENKGYWYYVAHWVDLNGSTKFKWFSILKYGENGAFTLAMKAREDAIANLIENGEWYGERHGQELNFN